MREYLRSRFRNWPGALRAAGLSRSAGRGGQACQQSVQKELEVRQLLAQVRKLEDLDQEDRQRLDALQAIAQALNRAPMSREVEEGLRIALLQRFGSWRNALYQIDLEPVRRISPFVNAPLHRGAGRSSPGKLSLQPPGISVPESRTPITHPCPWECGSP